MEKDEPFKAQRELINTIVKRNKIVHYNDDASDVSNSDLKENIKVISGYIKNIDKLICLQI